MAKSGIHIKPENKGKFNATKKRTGKSTEELTHSKNPVTRKRAIFAQNAKKWHHGKDGLYIPLEETFSEADSGIHIKPSKRGTFTAAAKKHGKSVQSFASQVLANKDDYSPAMVKKANFARNASKWHHAEDGVDLNDLQINNPSAFGYTPVAPQNRMYQQPTTDIFQQNGQTYYKIPEEQKLQDVPTFTPNKPSPATGAKGKSNPIAIGDFISAGIMGISALLPDNNKRKPLMPTMEYNPFSQGTGTQAIMKKGGKMYISKHYGEGGTEKKEEKLAQTKRVVNPELYMPFGNDQQLAQDRGWYPVQSTKDGTVTYNNGYGLLNTVMLPDKTKNGQLVGNGRLSIVGSHNGTFDIVINDKDNNFVQTIKKGIPFKQVDEYFTSQYGNIAQRTNDIQKNYNDSDAQESKKLIGANMKKGGTLSSSKAREILRDGTANGKPLTDKQKRYFGWVAGGKKAENGMEILDENTIEFQGDKHSDPSGGIPIAFSGKNVMVEGDETGYISPIDGSLTIGGNLKNPLTNRKFKSDFKILADKQAKTEKYENDGISLMNDYSPQDKWDVLKYNSGRAMAGGAKYKKSKITAAKEHLSDIQNAMIDIKEEQKQAKYGMKMAAEGDFLPTDDPILSYLKDRTAPSYLEDLGHTLRPVITTPTKRPTPGGQIVPTRDMSINMKAPTSAAPSYSVNNASSIYSPQNNDIYQESTSPVIGNFQDNPTYSNAKKLSFSQIVPELFAAATNQQEFVPLQQIEPKLFDPYSVSFQDRRNQNAQTFNALASSASPEIASYLASQKYEADNAVNAEEFRTNQAIRNDVINKNTALINETNVKNLALADQQYTRQAQAKAATKAQNRAIVQSISDKVAQNKLEQQTIKLYENLYNYRFNPSTLKSEYIGPAASELLDFHEDSLTPSTSSPFSSENKTTIRRDKNGNIVSTTSQTDPASVIDKRQSDAYIARQKKEQEQLNMARKFKLFSK